MLDNRIGQTRAHLKVTLVIPPSADRQEPQLLYHSRLYPNELSQNQIVVETTSVDKLLPELGITSVDSIKMDNQGFEGHAFSGMGNTLEKPLIILTEFWPKGLGAANKQRHEVLGKLVLKGFRLYELTSTGKLNSFEDLQALINRYPGRQYTKIAKFTAVVFGFPALVALHRSSLSESELWRGRGAERRQLDRLQAPRDKCWRLRDYCLA